MRYLLLILILSGSLFSCSQKKSFQQKISKLETQIEANEDSERATELKDTYLSYVTSFPGDTVLNNRYLYRAAGLAYRMQDYSGAIDYIHQSLEDYPNGDNSLNNALFLANLYQKDLRKPQVAYTILQAIELAFPNGLENSDQSLPGNIDNVFTRLDTMRNQIFDEASYSINFQLANDYLLAIEEFVRVAPQQSEAPTLLYNAAEIARSIQTYNKALELFNWLEAEYEGHTKEAQAMFLKAFTLDDGLKQYDEARKAYEDFIEKYPDNPFADDARFSIQNLGKDVNELIDGFEEEVQE